MRFFPSSTNVQTLTVFLKVYNSKVYKFQTPRAYCATHTIDLSHAISQIKFACPNAKLYAAGFSLGG